ncbi:hypothetical protein [Klebsiella pneumoniae]|uniref:hypothetical protein n=1 Tax=Klebsiella pneumoniae TaxID=573 RepID=UPI0022B69491|nr:hypothetical protein [Klebsiella pneumoniae]
MNSLLTLARTDEIESAAAEYGEMLKAAFSEHEVCQSGTERKRERESAPPSAPTKQEV